MDNKKHNVFHLRLLSLQLIAFRHDYSGQCIECAPKPSYRDNYDLCSPILPDESEGV